MPLNKEQFAELIAQKADPKMSKQAFQTLKQRVAHQLALTHVPKNTEILFALKKKDRERLHTLLVSKPTRTMSGVAPVAIMSAPIACPPQALCTYCPGGPKSIFGDVPKSYTDGAPAVKRAIRNKYDPYLQVFNRLEHYHLLNQCPTKVELIVMGGTFPSFEKAYRDVFIARALQAMNDFSTMFYTQKGTLDETKFRDFFLLDLSYADKEREKIIIKRMEALRDLKKPTVLDEQTNNETARIRCIALVIETRPDCATQKEIDEMLRYGTTRAEIGVQSLRDHVLKRIKRGHDVATTITATQELRDALFKITYHMMVGLPETTKETDIQEGKQLFDDPRFRPDSLKVYPCMVMAGTPLYEEYKKKLFTPVTTDEAMERIIEWKKTIPEYCRIMRVQRDLPTYMTEAGVDKTNLRQLMHNKKIVCRCIRCREPKEQTVDFDNVTTKVITYEASGGTECFIAKEDVTNDLLLGYARLRIPFKPVRKEITSTSAGIRELHVFGTALDMQKKPTKEVQHRGLGKELMEEAEKLARETYDKKKMVVIAGLGVREYYKKQLQYIQEGPYVSKKI